MNIAIVMVCFFLIQFKMSNLQLSLTKKWFELTKSGVKTEDYRELNNYWLKRISNVNLRMPISLTEQYSILEQNKDILFDGKSVFKKFDINIMTFGYPKSTDSERILKLEHKGIEIREGNPEWGAIPGRKYFVITHGSFLK